MDYNDTETRLKSDEAGNYKGIYYNDPSAESHYLDDKTGAHFNYQKIVVRLNAIKIQREKEMIASGEAKETEDDQEGVQDGKHITSLKNRQASNLMNIKNLVKKDSRSKSFEKGYHHVPQYDMQQLEPVDNKSISPPKRNDYQTYDESEPPSKGMFPKLRISQIESNALVGLHRKEKANGLSLHQIRNPSQDLLKLFSADKNESPLKRNKMAEIPLDLGEKKHLIGRENIAGAKKLKEKVMAQARAEIAIKTRGRNASRKVQNSIMIKCGGYTRNENVRESNSLFPQTSKTVAGALKRAKMVKEVIKQNLKSRNPINFHTNSDEADEEHSKIGQPFYQRKEDEALPDLTKVATKRHRVVLSSFPNKNPPIKGQSFIAAKEP